MSWPGYPFASRPNLQKVNDGDVHRNLLKALSDGRDMLRPLKKQLKKQYGGFQKWGYPKMVGL